MNKSIRERADRATGKRASQGRTTEYPIASARDLLHSLYGRLYK